MTTAVQMILSAEMPTTPRDPKLRGQGQKARSAAIRALLRDLVINSISVTSDT